MHDAFAYCAALVRAADRDRYIATLFAPAERRGALHALYAFNTEIGRVRGAAHAALPGEIRLQWWSDVINAGRTEEANANPVASALLATLERFQLAPEKLLDLIEAHRFDLYDEPMAKLEDLEGYARRTSSALFSLAVGILDGGDAGTVTDPAGIAWTIADVLGAFPLHVTRRQLYVPLDLLERHGVRMHDVFAGRSSRGLKAAFAELRRLALNHLDQARIGIAALKPQAIPALLPLARVRPSLTRAARADPFAPKEIAPWRRQWLMWRAARTGRLAG